mgnify:CR=1 FL=1
MNPLILIPPTITEINGIRNEDVENAPPINDVLLQLLNFIGNNFTCAHNVSFDMKFLLTIMYEHGLVYKRFQVADILSLARKYKKSTKNHKQEI